MPSSRRPSCRNLTEASSRRACTSIRSRPSSWMPLSEASRSSQATSSLSSIWCPKSHAPTRMEKGTHGHP